MTYGEYRAILASLRQWYPLDTRPVCLNCLILQDRQGCALCQTAEFLVANRSYQSETVLELLMEHLDKIHADSFSDIMNALAQLPVRTNE